MATISISNLTVGYDAEPVIKDFSLNIADGSLFTLLGPSGCGKTTLLRTIAGFIPMRGGSLHFGERDVTRLPAHLRDVGMVFQDYALFPDKTVFDNVAYGLRARKKDAATIKATVGEYLERVGLSAFAERVPAALSGGQRQRVALARALAIKPTVLLMDEPLSNLDAKLRVQVRETIADLQKEIGITTVLVTHDQEEALALSDRIGLIREGKLEQAGTPEELYAKPRTAYVADFVGAANILSASIATRIEANTMASVQLAEATVRAHAPEALATGAVALIARGESLKLLPRDAAGSNLVPCTIRRRQYLGARTTYTVDIAGDAAARSVRVETHDDAKHWAVGERAQLQFDSEKTLVVAS
jgi:iron(III) transport system ATP-binding protein